MQGHTLPPDPPAGKGGGVGGPRPRAARHFRGLTYMNLMQYNNMYCS